VVPLPSRSLAPERWLWSVAGSGWLALAVLPLTAGHAHAHASIGPHVGGGLAMVAIMLPLVGPNVRYAAQRSPGRLRRAVAIEIAAAYALVWTAAAIGLGLATWALLAVAGSVVAVALVTGLAAAWQFAPLKRRSLARCDRRLAPPLAPRRARGAARRFGVLLGRDCVLSCGPLMGLMAVTGHSVSVAAACLAIVWYERRFVPHHHPATVGPSLVLLGLGATVLGADVLGRAGLL
jgi:predicted metal-binding membrane protein